jgi:streptomycin 3"-adenylyltransferase
MRTLGVPVDWAARLVDSLSTVPGWLPVGAYVHGSAALGGFVPGRSDVDLLFVVRRALAPGAKEALAAAIQAFPGCPGVGIETSLLTVEQAANPVSGGFELHICTGPGAKVVEGYRHAGDDDLVLHALVVRAAGIALHGPPAAELLGDVDPANVRQRLRSELAWALKNAPARYAVLNASRAVFWAQHSVVASKIVGGEWGLTRFPEHSRLIRRALDEQAGATGAPEPVHGSVARFVKEALRILDRPVP